MGILNVTPDSFFDGGKYFSPENALKRGFEMIEQGADLVDIGGESTRPFATSIPAQEEVDRILPLVKSLSHHVKISIDTSKVEVAKKAVDEGASFLNDITGFSDPAMRELAANRKLEICIMHMQGSPKTMQISPLYPQGIIHELLQWFNKRIQLCIDSGIKKEKIYIDPGIGFGKSVEDNLTILRNLSDFHQLGAPLLLGVSRKSFMSKILGKSAQDLLSTTLAINTISILEGVQIIRVHDVREHREMVDMITTLF